jgi:mevalonate pyrophosphate decarboxylase
MKMAEVLNCPAWMLVCSLPSGRMAEVSAHVAQSVEHFLGKEEVTGSIPVMSTISFTRRG